MIVLEIPRIPESPNMLRGVHWRVRHKHTKLWQQEVVMALLQSQQRPPAPYPKARVSIHRRSRGELDPDNLMGSVKPVIDALRHAQVLVNDTARHIELSVTQSRGQPRTTIHVEALPAVGAIA